MTELTRVEKSELKAKQKGLLKKEVNTPLTNEELAKAANQNKDKTLKSVAWELRAARHTITRFEERRFMEMSDRIESLEQHLAMRAGLFPPEIVEDLKTVTGWTEKETG